MSTLDNYLNLIRQILKYGDPDAYTANDTYILDSFDKLLDKDKVELIKNAALCDELTGVVDNAKESTIAEIHQSENNIKDTVITEKDEIEKTNKIELIKLKIWFIKFFIAVVLISILTVSVLSLMLGDNLFNTTHGLMKEIQDIWNIVF